MGRYIKSVQMIVGEELPEVERIDSQLKALILSAEGTIPGSRGFGLPQNFVSMNPREAANIIAIELEEKVEEFIPDITISDVEARAKTDGSMAVKIFVERRK